ncbi:MAG TPA: glutamine synthetase family protein [Oligoflexia bacterium]|nr:glutamine synthetase family protein [Oligoflexia bacterium]HMP48580.1 glutamine synthetase family protein [Oligoflexia bacterium]
MSIQIKDFLEISYEQLEELNLTAKKKISDHVSEDTLKEFYLKYLADEKQLKAVTVGFSDLEGRFHMLDYDKKFLLKSYDNLTFDGSSIRGLTAVSESDLRLEIDWGSFRWLPSDVFGGGKVIVFAQINDRDGSFYRSDIRGVLKQYCNQLWNADKTELFAAVETEGFLFQGVNAEQNFNSREGFKFVSSGGYYHTLPKDQLKVFIDRFAEAKRAMGFENEKDHPEVAPSQFELNYNYCDALIAADQIQLYKLLARQIAAEMGMTASFLPKPVANINGSGMHTNISVARGGKNLFYDKSGEDNLSGMAWDFVDRILSNALDICLVLNSSVNSYRRLDPQYEAPNQIMASAVNRTAMVRIPLGNEKSARVEVRTVAPDANPYLTMYTLFKTGLEGEIKSQFTGANRKLGNKTLPDNIYTAITDFRESSFIKELVGSDNAEKFADLKEASANRCPRELGNMVKSEEILFHHEVTNQYIWKRF